MARSNLAPTLDPIDISTPVNLDALQQRMRAKMRPTLRLITGAAKDAVSKNWILTPAWNSRAYSDITKIPPKIGGPFATGAGFYLTGAANAVACDQGYLPESRRVARPVTQPLTLADAGVTAVYDVGAGKTYADLSAVPWATLPAGAAVNVYYDAIAYNTMLGLRASGTSANPVIIHGVTDANGNLPIIDFSGATVAATCNPSGGYNGTDDIYSETLIYGQALGGIVIKRGQSDDPATYNPAYITFQNLRLQGAADGNTFTGLQGVAGSFSGFGAAIYALRGDHITIDNCEITDCMQAVFTNANNHSNVGDVSSNTLIKNSAIWGCGIVGNEGNHNGYLQGKGVVVEGCFFGHTRDGAGGNNMKFRASGVVVRRSLVVSTAARWFDIVQTEGSGSPIPTDDIPDGVIHEPDYGVARIYCCELIVDFSESQASSAVIHVGCDNIGEQSASPTAFYPTAISNGVTYDLTDQCIKTLYFYNNTIAIKNVTTIYKFVMFQASWPFVQIFSQNNIYRYDVSGGQPNYSWLDICGTIYSKNDFIIVSDQALLSTILEGYNPDPEHYSSDISGTIYGVDSDLTDIVGNDFAIPQGSSAAGSAAALPIWANGFVEDITTNCGAY